ASFRRFLGGDRRGLTWQVMASGPSSGTGRSIRTHQMCQDKDTSNAVIRPPVAWTLALVAGVAADRLYPLRIVPASVPGAWVGGAIFATWSLKNRCSRSCDAVLPMCFRYARRPASTLARHASK